MKITEINRDVCKQLRDILDDAMQAKLKELGLDVKCGNASFDSELVTFKVDIKVAGSLDKRDKQLSDSLSWYIKYIAEELGVDKDDVLNKEYRMGVTRYKLIGYNSKAKSYPLIMQDTKTGKKYKFPDNIIKRAFMERVV
tara:strand:+ start:42 stop:461 length:420 start_codon:yes stop_codon:yes gene_type:complete